MIPANHSIGLRVRLHLLPFNSRYMRLLVMMSEFVRASGRFSAQSRSTKIYGRGYLANRCSAFVFSTSLHANSLIIQKMRLCCVHLSDVLLLEVNRSFHSIISKYCKVMEFMKRVGQCGLVLVLNVALV